MTSESISRVRSERPLAVDAPIVVEQDENVMITIEPLPAISAGCTTCPVHNAANLRKLGIDMTGTDFVVALAGNPNVGKSTVFNALTGLRQHTGNWPGKTVTRAEGGFEYGGHRYKIVDLPGTYSLLATSLDEEVARDFILFGQPDVTLVVVDATRLERNLNLVLQVLEITDRVVVCLNLMDEARRHGLQVDERRLARDLGVPVVPTEARRGKVWPSFCRPSAMWRQARRCANRTGCVTSRPRSSTPLASWWHRLSCCSPACRTRAGWRCACWTAMSASPRPCAKANWASSTSLSNPTACLPPTCGWKWPIELIHAWRKGGGDGGRVQDPPLRHG